MGALFPSDRLLIAMCSMYHRFAITAVVTASLQQAWLHLTLAYTPEVAATCLWGQHLAATEHLAGTPRLSPAGPGPQSPWHPESLSCHSTCMANYDKWANTCGSFTQDADEECIDARARYSCFLERRYHEGT